MAVESFGKDGDRFADCDPCYAVYVGAQNMASVMAEFISEFKEAKGFARIVEHAEREYMPSWPPMNPVTKSYFAMWTLFDVRFGSSRETMGSCILQIAPEFDSPSWLVDAVSRMQRSRMGFYVHCGSEGEEVLLREVVTQEVIPCMIPSGYVGDEGQIWFVRVLEPPDDLCSQHIVINSPYVVREYPESAFVYYLDRKVGRMEKKRPPGMDDAYSHLMKYGREVNYWNEYIFCAY